MQSQSDDKKPCRTSIYRDLNGEIRYYDLRTGRDVFGDQEELEASKSEKGSNFFSLDDVTYKGESAEISAWGRDRMVTILMAVKPGYQLKFSYDGQSPIPGTYTAKKVFYRHPDNSLWPEIHSDYLWLLERNNLFESKVHIHDARNSGQFSGTYEIALHYYTTARQYKFAKMVTGSFSAIFQEG